MPSVPNGVFRPISAGVVSALVGFTSAFVVVLSGLKGVGANPSQASSGLLAVSVTMGLSCILLAGWTRMPITVAWSTPGAALLAFTGTVQGGWPAAVGAFLVTGALIVLTGLVPQLGALIARIPASVAQAMLAGVLFQLCLGPIVGLATNPLAVAPVVAVWLLALRLLPRWAAPLAAGPEAGEDRSRRWIASVTAGVVLVLLGIASTAWAGSCCWPPPGSSLPSLDSRCSRLSRPRCMQRSRSRTSGCPPSSFSRRPPRGS